MTNKFKKEDYKLCYIKNNYAYFTTQDLEKQWGDDWNDAPYEYNAGDPYEGEWDILKIFFESTLNTPSNIYTRFQYSVEDINTNKVPWLEKDQNIIMAGCSIDDFIKKIIDLDGKIYLEYKINDEQV